MTDEQIFAHACYVILMSHSEEETPHPNYLSSKAKILTMGYDAFGALDVFNMRRIMNWAETWKVELPEQVKEHYKMEEDAYQKLMDQGILI